VSAALASFQSSAIDLGEGALLFLLKNGNRARHRAKAAFPTQLYIMSEFNHAQSSL
jgi:hypothetical protein